MEEPLFMFQLIIAVDVSEHRSIYNKLNAPCSGDFKQSITRDVVTQVPLDQMVSVAVWQYTRREFEIRQSQRIKLRIGQSICIYTAKCDG